LISHRGSLELNPFPETLVWVLILVHIRNLLGAIGFESCPV
jgi:hypothetical protein